MVCLGIIMLGYPELLPQAISWRIFLFSLVVMLFYVLYKAMHPFHQLKIKWYHIGCKRTTGLLCMRGSIKFLLVLWWRLCKWVFFSSQKQLFNVTNYICRRLYPSHKPSPFPSCLLISSFCCPKSSSICLAHPARAEGLPAKPLFRLGTGKPQGTTSTFPLQRWEVSPLSFPCVTDDCGCNS